MKGGCQSQLRSVSHTHRQDERRDAHTFAILYSPPTLSMPSASPSHEFRGRSKRDGDPKMIGLWKVGRTIGKGNSDSIYPSLRLTGTLLTATDHRSSETRATHHDWGPH